MLTTPDSDRALDKILQRLGSARRRYLDPGVAALVALLVLAGVFFHFLRYFSGEEVTAPFEFSILSAALGGFLLVFRTRSGQKQRVNLNFVAKLFWAAAISFIVLTITSPMLNSGGSGSLEYWTLTVIVGGSLVISGLTFAVACCLIAYTLWDL